MLKTAFSLPGWHMRCPGVCYLLVDARVTSSGQSCLGYSKGNETFLSGLVGSISNREALMARVSRSTGRLNLKLSFKECGLRAVAGVFDLRAKTQGDATSAADKTSYSESSSGDPTLPVCSACILYDAATDDDFELPSCSAPSQLHEDTRSI